MARIGMVLLAAGASSRMGSPKQLLNFQGTPLIRHAVDEALKSMCETVIVVVGSGSSHIRDLLAGWPVEIVENADWESGIGSSIRAGVSRAEALSLSGIVLALADQPLIVAGIYNRLILTWQVTKKPIIASQYAGTVGVPALFAAELFCKLMALPPGQGCKELILSSGPDAVRLECAEAEVDIDTPEDYERLGAL